MMNNVQELPNPVTRPASPPTDWAALLMGLLLLLNALILTLFALLLTLLGWNTQFTAHPDEALPLLKLGAGALTLAVLLTPGVYLNARKFLNQPPPRFSLHKLPSGLWVILLFVAWVISLLMGNGVVAYPHLTLLLLPLINIAALVLPVGIILAICLRGLPMPSPRRAWSIFGANTVLAPTLALFFEMFAFVGFGTLFLLYASSTPGLNVTFWSLIEELQNEMGSQEFVSRQAATLLLAPGARILLLGLFALAVPIIEEAFKVFLLWFYAGRMRSPVEGFIAGVLCGAAFALSENIGFASSGTEEWLANVLVRTSAILPHVFNCGLVGWALVGAWQTPAADGKARLRRYLSLGLAYLTALLIHGIWNALSVALAFTSFNEFAADIPSLLKTSVPLAVTWGVLILGLFLGLFIANRQMRKQVVSETARDVEYNSPD